MNDFSQKKNRLDNYFGLSKNNTNVKTEVVAGITTFMTMAYILIVNPSIQALPLWTRVLYLQQQPFQQ